jgi:hypothetical protein
MSSSQQDPHCLLSSFIFPKFPQFFLEIPKKENNTFFEGKKKQQIKN